MSYHPVSIAYHPPLLPAPTLYIERASRASLNRQSYYSKLHDQQIPLTLPIPPTKREVDFYSYVYLSTFSLIRRKGIILLVKKKKKRAIVALNWS